MSSKHDHALNLVVSRALSAGMALSGLLAAAALALDAARPGRLSHEATPLSRLPAGLAQGDPTALLSLAILVLLATPAVRVVVLAWGYARRRDWLFAALALFVLAVLALSVWSGRAR